MLTEPSAVFFETGEIASFTSADGSVSSTARGLLEADVTDRPTGETTRECNGWNLTIATADAGEFGEGDKVTIRSVQYTILDRLGDSTQTTFLLEEPI